MNERQGERLVLLVLGGHNLVQNLLLNERGYVTGNMAVTAAVVGLARRAGCGWQEMGLQAGDLRTGMRIAGQVSVGLALPLLLSANHPRARTYLQDERGTMASRRQSAVRALVRFPIGTALFEEITFRGVVPALARRAHGPVLAETLPAAAFGLWHVIPTFRALQGNAAGRRLPPSRRAGIALAGAASTSVVGLGAGWLVRKTKSLLAPWLIHSVVNSSAFLAAVVGRHDHVAPPARGWAPGRQAGSQRPRPS